MIAGPIRPSKELGQNFLTCHQALQTIASLAHPLPLEDGILEIGPGQGALTRLLLDSGHQVLAIEKDSRMVRHLASRLGGRPLEVINGDILDRNISPDPVKWPLVFGNLPYNISLAILQKLLFSNPSFKKMVLMFQLEVAQRLIAPHGSRTFGVPSLMLSALARARLELVLEPECFYPAPKVKSALLSLEPYDLSPEKKKAVEEFLDTVSLWFRFRRKNILNALKHSGQEDSSSLLVGLNIAPTARLEELAPQRLWALHQAILASTTPNSSAVGQDGWNPYSEDSK